MTNPSDAYGVHSEVGRLRKVLVCAPGLAHERLTPSNCDDLLFDDVLWVDEGTEWQDGLSHVLQRWLGQGEGLAFPETSESASRDRREITPTDLLLSPRRVEALAAEIEARLAPPGSWRRWACDWALANQQRAAGRRLKARVRRLLGFARLRRIEVPSAPPAAALARPAAWLHEYLERAA